MPTPSQRYPIDTGVYRRLAFDALAWVGITFEAAMADPTRREIIEHIATRWPQKMENIVPISRIEQLAQRAAAHYVSARDANPYPDNSAAGGLFVKCFHAKQKILAAQVMQAQAAIETIAT